MRKLWNYIIRYRAISQVAPIFLTRIRYSWKTIGKRYRSSRCSSIFFMGRSFPALLHPPPIHVFFTLLFTNEFLPSTLLPLDNVKRYTLDKISRSCSFENKMKWKIDTGSINKNEVCYSIDSI